MFSLQSMIIQMSIEIEVKERSALVRSKFTQGKEFKLDIVTDGKIRMKVHYLLLSLPDDPSFAHCLKAR